MRAHLQCHYSARTMRGFTRDKKTPYARVFQYNKVNDETAEVTKRGAKRIKADPPRI